MNQVYVAPNGETLVATNDSQAHAFERAGMVKADAKPKKTKTDE